MRYAGYVRTSSAQVDNQSIDIQKRAIEAWVTARGGALVGVYVDQAASGQPDHRPGFQAMKRDAQKGKFDTLVVHKLDRLTRDQTDLAAIRSTVAVFSMIE